MNVLSLTYLGNVQYFSKLCFLDCIVDVHENYLKQSYRNRCDILTANGPVSLTVNVANNGNWPKTKVKDVRIDHSKRWQHQHWQSIVSAYRNSPYFDFYAEKIEPYYKKQFDFLIDFNAGLTETVLDILGMGSALKLSDRYMDAACEDFNDLRDAISPKLRLRKADPSFTPQPYWQVFSERFPFVPNLSVIDLLFCEGPAAKGILGGSLLPPASSI